MGFISDLLDSIMGDGHSGSSDPKVTTNTNNGDEVRVRNSDVVVNHDTGKHDTIWSSTTVNVNTGEAKSSEGGHGPNFK